MSCKSRRIIFLVSVLIAISFGVIGSMCWAKGKTSKAATAKNSDAESMDDVKEYITPYSDEGAVPVVSGNDITPEQSEVVEADVHAKYEIVEQGFDDNIESVFLYGQRYQLPIPLATLYGYGWRVDEGSVSHMDDVTSHDYVISANMFNIDYPDEYISIRMQRIEELLFDKLNNYEIVSLEIDAQYFPHTDPHVLFGDSYQSEEDLPLSSDTCTVSINIGDGIINSLMLERYQHPVAEPSYGYELNWSKGVFNLYDYVYTFDSIEQELIDNGFHTIVDDNGIERWINDSHEQTGYIRLLKDSDTLIGVYLSELSIPMQCSVANVGFDSVRDNIIESVGNNPYRDHVNDFGEFLTYKQNDSYLTFVIRGEWVHSIIFTKGYPYYPEVIE